MRKSFCAKVALLAMLVPCTCALTSFVLNSRRKVLAEQPAQQPTASTAPAVRTTVVSVKRKTRKKGARQTQAALLASDPRTYASGAMRSFTASVEGNTIHVKAAAYIHDKRINATYVWSVRILDPQNKEDVLFEKLYKEQVFALPAEREIAPTFEDVIELPLPVGTYVLNVVVFKVPEGGLAALSDSRISENSRGPSGMTKITIGK